MSASQPWSMKHRLLLIASGVFAVAVIGGFTTAVRAQDGLAELNEEKVQTIRLNCVAAQVSIQRLQNSDVVARTNRGRSYENILKLMAAFNTRVAANKLSEPKLIETTGQMQRRVTEFYTHYDTYRDTIEKLVHMNCREQPISFYQELEQLRRQREVLKNDVATLDKYVADYAALVADLRVRLTAPPASPSAGEGGP